jgi:zinc protease
MQDEGTASRTALQISEEQMKLGATLGTGSSLDNSTVNMTALKARLDASLDLFVDVALNPVFPQEEIDRQRKQVLGQIMQEKRQPVQMGIRILPGIVYGAGHPYGQPLTGSGTVEVVNSISKQDLQSFHSTWFRPNNATMIVVGDITLAEVTPKLEKAFGSWQRGEVPQIMLPDMPQPERMTVYIIDKPGAAQSVLLAAHLMPPRNDPGSVPFEVLNSILGGEFTSRVNMNLREDKGYSYGAFTFPLEARGQGMFICFSAVRTDVTKESIAELRKEISDIRGPRPVTAAELAKAQENLVLQLPGEYESLGEIAGMINDVVTYDLPEDYFTSYPEKIRATTIDGLTELARERILPDNTALVVVGDRKVIEPKIRELGLTHIEFLDAEGRPMAESSAQR